MKSLIALMFAALLFVTPLQAADPVSTTCNLTVKGMVCSSCSTAVKKALTALPGIRDVSVDIKKNLVVVTYDRKKITVPQMVHAVRKAGFQAELPK